MDELGFERRLTETEQRSKSNTHQIEELKQRQNNLDELVRSVAELASELGHVKDDVGEVKKDLRDIMDKPGDRWESLVDKIIFAAAGAVIAWIAAGVPGL